MNKPVNDWDKWYIAQDFGNPTDYGFHEGWDLNLKTGGDTDLNQPILAVKDGKIVYFHYGSHPTKNFGRHLVEEVEVSSGKRWIHVAHCSDKDFLNAVQAVKAGQMVARVGKTGTPVAHIHLAVFKVDPGTLPNGIDTIAKTKQQLNDWWEDPEIFFNQTEENMGDALTDCRIDREKFWKERDALLAVIPATDIDNATKVIGGYKSSVTQAQTIAGEYKAQVENREEQVGKLKERVSDLETKLKTATDEAKANWIKYDNEGKAKGELNKAHQTLQIQCDALKQQIVTQTFTITVKDFFMMLWNQKITFTKGS